MKTSVQIVALIGIVVAVPLTATGVGRWLAARHAPDGPSPAIVNFNQRVDAWWAMLVLTGLAFAFGKRGLIVLFGVLSLAALREFMTLTRLRSADHWALLMAFFVAVPVQYYLIWTEWYGLYSILIPVYAFVLMPIVSAIRGEPKAFLERIAEAQWGLMISVYCLSHVPALAMLKIAGYEGRALLLVAYLLLVVHLSDVFQYVWGKLLGRTAVAPTLSPAKTAEGTVLGIASATAVGAALWWITPFAPIQAALLSLVTTVLGFLGGLVMSSIKRDRGVKDWGRLIQGHGGILDRLDSLAFAAPVFFHVTRHWWTD